MDKSPPDPPVIDDLHTFTAHHPVLHQHNALWAEGTIRLSIATYLLGENAAPATCTTSGRCIVLARNQVLVMQNPDEQHVLPGGRIEQGESSHAAAIRELREEAGVTVQNLTPLATMVFRHLTPRPTGYPYPYPLFTNDIFVTRLPEPVPIVTTDDYEQAGRFVPVTQILPDLTEHQRLLLLAAQNLLPSPG